MPSTRSSKKTLKARTPKKITKIKKEPAPNRQPKRHNPEADALVFINADKGFCCRNTYRLLQRNYNEAKKNGNEDRVFSAYLAQFLMRDLKTTTYLLRDSIHEPYAVGRSRTHVEWQFSKEELVEWEFAGLVQSVKETRFEICPYRFGDKQPNGTFTYYNRFTGFRAKKLDRHIQNSEVQDWTRKLDTVSHFGDKLKDCVWYLGDIARAATFNYAAPTFKSMSKKTFTLSNKQQGQFLKTTVESVFGKQYIAELQLVDGSQIVGYSNLLDKLFVFVNGPDNNETRRAVELVKEKIRAAGDEGQTTFVIVPPIKYGSCFSIGSFDELHVLLRNRPDILYTWLLEQYKSSYFDTFQ